MLAYSAAGHPSPLGNTSNIFKYSRLVLRSGCHVSLSYEKVYFIQSCTVCRGWPPPSHCPNSCTSYKLSFSRLDQDSCSPVRPQLTTWLWFLSLCPCCRGAQSPRQTLGDHNSKFIYWANFLFVSSSRLQALTFTVPSGVFFFYHASSTVKVPTEGLRFS